MNDKAKRQRKNVDKALASVYVEEGQEAGST